MNVMFQLSEKLKIEVTSFYETSVKPYGNKSFHKPKQGNFVLNLGYLRKRFVNSSD
jgi:hypothetical protein